MAAGKVSDIVLMNGAELSAAIKANRVSCAEVMTAYLDHIAGFNPKVNAIVSLRDRDACVKDARDKDAELAGGNYQGWMHGFPHAVKDLAAAKGIRLTMGSPLFKDFIAPNDSIHVERMKRAGATICSGFITCSDAPACQVRNMLWTERSKVMSQVSAARSSGVRANQSCMTSR